MANINSGPFTTRPEIDGTFGVVASTHWIGTAVGMSMLERGGNAFDAGVATAFTLQVVEPHLCGPGGDVPAILWDAKAKKPIVVCGQGPAPAGATIAHYRDHLGLDIMPGTGLLPACVPGTFETYMMILRDFGTMRLRDVLEPAIGYARNGYPAGRARLRHHRHGRQALPRALADLGGSLPAGRQGARAQFALHQRQARRDLRAHPQGGRGRRRRPRKGDRAGAARLEPGLRRRGDRCLLPHQRGDGRERPAAQGRAHGAGHGDLAADARGADPSRLRQLSRAQAHAWTQGPVLLQMLALLEGFDLDKLSPTDADFIHTWVECAKLAYADREAFYGDPKFVDVPMETLLSEPYNAARRKLVGAEASMEQRPGKIEGHAGRVIVKGARAAAAGAGEPTFARLHTGHGAGEQRCRPAARWSATRCTSTSSTRPATCSPPRRRAAGCSPRR